MQIWIDPDTLLDEEGLLRGLTHEFCHAYNHGLCQLFTEERLANFIEDEGKQKIFVDIFDMEMERGTCDLSATMEKLR